MKKIENIYDLLVCQKVGKMMEMVAENHRVSEISAIHCWFKTALCRELALREPTLICQSSTYFYNTVKEEIQKLPVHKDHIVSKDAMYWLGYISEYWILSEQVSIEKIQDMYDSGMIYSSYDTLHTLSTIRQIEEIKKMTKGTTVANMILQ